MVDIKINNKFIIGLYMICLLVIKAIAEGIIGMQYFADVMIMTGVYVIYLFISFFVEKLHLYNDDHCCSNSGDKSYNIRVMYYSLTYIIYNAVMLIVLIGKTYGKQFETLNITGLITATIILILDIMISSIYMIKTHRKQEQLLPTTDK